jgi:Zn-dependent protease with chaperone function
MSDPPTSPRPLAGLYLLVFAVLAGVGATAGNILFAGYPAVSRGALRTLGLCQVQFPVATQGAAYNSCAASGYRVQGLLAVGGIATILVAAAAMAVAAPWADWWRVARAGRVQLEAQDEARLAERFNALCGFCGLTGRRRPRLVVAGPAINQAFTGALPTGRPQVVLPAAVAFAYDNPGQFDPVVLHELAHVRARDVSWASPVRWIAWLTVPAIAAPALVDLLSGTMTSMDAVRPVAQAVVFVVAALVIAAGLLRQRELEADRQAAAWQGSAEALRHALSAGGTPAPAAIKRLSLRAITRLWQPLTRHPSVPARIAALADRADRRDGGFAYALALGVVTALAMSTASFLALSLDFADGGTLPPRASAATGAVLLGAGLTPMLTRLAARSRQGTVVRWWRPVAGTGAGLACGLLVAPGTVPGPFALFGPGADLKVGTANAVLTAVAGAGITAMAAGLASRTGPPGRRIWLALTISCCAATALWPVPTIAYAWGMPGERLWLAIILPTDRWDWLALAYPAAMLLVTAQSRRLVTRHAATAALTPACAAIVGATLLLAAGLPAGDRPFAVALLGWLVLAVLAVADGIAGLPRACASAWLATLLAGAELLVLAGPHTQGWLAAATARPSVWLFYLALPTSLLAAARSRPPTAARRPWIVPVVAAAGSAVLAALLPGTIIASLLAPDLAVTTLPSLPAQPQNPAPAGPEPLPVPSGPLPAGADRILSGASVAGIVSQVGTAVGFGLPGQALAPARPGNPYDVRSGCLPLFDMAFLAGLPAPVSQSARQYEQPVVPPAFESVVVQVKSYPVVIPDSVLSAARADLSACPRFTATATDPATIYHYVTGSLPTPAVGTLAWQAALDVTSQNTDFAATWTMIIAGHNLVFIATQTTASFFLPPQPQALTGTALAAALIALRGATASR